MAPSEADARCASCGGAGKLRCTGCRAVSYCGREHQKEHWKSHRKACLPYEVKSSSELGRHLIAVRDLMAPDLLLSETPLVFGPKSLPDPEAIMPCVGCYRPVSTEVGERCAKCGWPVCSGLCPGLADPQHHGLECIILSLRPECAVNNMANYYRHDALLALRCLLLQQRAPKKWKKLLEMQSHIESRKPDTDIYRETDEYIVKYLNDNFLHPLRSVENHLNTHVVPEISDQLLHTICGIIDVNALEVRLNNGAELLGLYSNTSLMEHNCLPNTKHVFDVISDDMDNFLKISVKVVLPIKKGEHITTMYSHALWGTQARRQHLKDTKYFACSCERCKDPTELGTYLGAMKCLGDGTNPCDGIHLPEDPLDDNTEWACNTCPMKVKSEQVNFLISQMAEEVEHVQMSSPSVTILEDFLEKLSTFLHPNHYHIYSVKHSLIQLYGYQQGYLYKNLDGAALQKKIDMCKELIDITTKLDPGNARLSLYTAVLHHELHNAIVCDYRKKKEEYKITKLEGFDKIDEAKVHLERALRVLADEFDGSAGSKLYAVIKESEKTFNKLCAEIYM